MLITLSGVLVGPSQAFAGNPFATPGDAVVERVDDRTAFSRTWELASGDHVTQTTATPSQWRDADGSWRLFDSTLRQAEDGWIGKVGRARVEVPTRLAGGPAGAVSVTSARGDAVHMTFRGRSALGEVSGDTVVYREALDGVDVRITVTTQGAKEDVILRHPDGQRNFSYLLQTSSPGLALVALDSGALAVRRDGRPVFTIPAPVMLDAQGETSKGNSYKVRRLSAQAWDVEPVLDHAWLNARERSWPVDVDPSVLVETPEIQSSCQFYLSEFSYSYCAVPTGEVGIRYDPGYISDGGETAYQVRFANASDPTHTIVDAKLKFRLACAAGSDTCPTIGLFELNKSVHNGLSHDPTPLATWSSGSSPSSPGQEIEASITSTAASWQEFQSSDGAGGTENHGLVFRIYPYVGLEQQIWECTYDHFNCAAATVEPPAGTDASGPVLELRTSPVETTTLVTADPDLQEDFVLPADGCATPVLEMDLSSIPNRARIESALLKLTPHSANTPNADLWLANENGAQLGDEPIGNLPELSAEIHFTDALSNLVGEGNGGDTYHVVLCGDGSSPSDVTISGSSSPPEFEVVYVNRTPAEQAYDTFEEVHPAAVADDPASALSASSDGYVAENGASVPNTLQDAVELPVDNGAATLEVKPTGIESSAGEAVAAGDAAVVYAETNESADTLIRSTEHGIETFTAIRNDDAPTTYDYDIDLTGDQELVETEDGGVAVIDPTPPVATPSGPKPPDVAAGTPESDALRDEHDIDETDVPDADSNEEQDLEQALETVGDPLDEERAQEESANIEIPAEPDGYAPPPNPEDGVQYDPPGPMSPEDYADEQVFAAEGTAEALADDTHDTEVEHAGEVRQRLDGLDDDLNADMQADASGYRLVAEIKPTWAKDADGEPVETDLTVVDDNTVRMTVDHDDPDVAYPVVADPWVETYITTVVYDRVPIYETRRYVSHYAIQTQYVTNVHVGWCWNPEYSCVHWSNGWWSMTRSGPGFRITLWVPFGHNGPWAWYPAYFFHEVPVYATMTVLVGWRTVPRYVTTRHSVWVPEDGGEQDWESGVVMEHDQQWWETTSDQDGARAAGIPLAIAVCARACLPAGKLAVGLFKKTKKVKPGQVKIPRAPAAGQHLAAAWRGLANRATAAEQLGLNMLRQQYPHMTTAQLRAELAVRRAQGLVPHHIVPIGNFSGKVSYSQWIMMRAGIHPNNPINGVWIQGAYHRPIHTNAYLHNIALALRGQSINPTYLGTNLVLNQLRSTLLNKAMPH